LWGYRTNIVSDDTDLIRICDFIRPIRYKVELWDVGQGFDSRQEQNYYLLHNVQTVSGALSQGVMRPESEADHSSPSSAELKKGEAISQLPHMALMA
jgi:hypothetical protein